MYEARYIEDLVQFIEREATLEASIEILRYIFTEQLVEIGDVNWNKILERLSHRPDSAYYAEFLSYILILTLEAGIELNLLDSHFTLSNLGMTITGMNPVSDLIDLASVLYGADAETVHRSHLSEQE